MAISERRLIPSLARTCSGWEPAVRAVVRPGGTIGLISWTPEGFLGTARRAG